MNKHLVEFSMRPRPTLTAMPFITCLLSALVVLLAQLPASDCDAQNSLAGQWREGAMRVRVQVLEWGEDCGPRPRSSSGRGNRQIEIQQPGDHLIFVGRRSRSTRDCWSENRAVRRVSSSAQRNAWRTVCRTPPSDSRAETGTYTFRSSGPNRIEFRDESEYDWELNDSSCRASIISTRSYTRIEATPTQPTETTPTEPVARPERARCTPGEAARVVSRPVRGEVDPGGEICFRLTALDDSGCPLRVRPTLQIGRGEGQVEGSCYQAPNQLGQAMLLARLGSLERRIEVSIHPLDLSALIARRAENERALDADDREASDFSAGGVAAHTESTTSPWRWALLVALLLVALTATIALVRNRQRKSLVPPVARYIGKLEATPDGVSSSPPPLRKSKAPDGIQSDSNISALGSVEDLICPLCRRGFSPEETHCDDDGTKLVSYAEYLENQELIAQKKQKICPECGSEYDASVAFCVKDGTTLEELS